MLMFDAATEDRRALIENTPRERAVYESPTLENRRRKALERLGERWVLHPNYNPALNPRHAVFVR